MRYVARIGLIELDRLSQGYARAGLLTIQERVASHVAAKEKAGNHPYTNIQESDMIFIQ